jgi:hypothetical protein
MDLWWGGKLGLNGGGDKEGCQDLKSDHII